MIDWSKVTELRDEIGAEDFGDVVELFLSEVEERLSQMAASPAQSMPEDDLHFLKGSALNLGFETFANLCQNGETAAKTGTGDLPDMEILLSLYKQSKEDFLAGLEKLPSA